MVAAIALSRDGAPADARPWDGPHHQTDQCAGGEQEDADHPATIGGFHPLMNGMYHPTSPNVLRHGRCTS
jgi:hypothetical protein